MRIAHDRAFWPKKRKIFFRVALRHAPVFGPCAPRYARFWARRAFPGPALEGAGNGPAGSQAGQKRRPLPPAAAPLPCGSCPAPAGVRFAVQAAPAALGAFPAPETSGRGSFRAWEAGRRKPAARSSRRAPAPAAAGWPRIPADRGLCPGKRPTGARDGPVGRSSGKDSRHTLPPTPCGPWREIPRRIFRRDRRRTE